MATAAEVLQAGIAGAVQRVVDHEAVIRQDVDPEGIHQARVGTRRLRSDLRTCRPIVDTAWSEPLRDELGWLAAELGAVRDRDVLAARLRRGAVALPDAEADGLAGVFARLRRERDAALAGAVGTLDSDRYGALMERLVDAAAAPRTTKRAEAPARVVLPALTAAMFGKLRRGVRRLGEAPPDEALHEVRIRAKRVRYAAELATPAVRGAKATAKAAAALQDVLGDLHDCVVAEEWLRAALPRCTRPEAFAVGLLVGVERAEAEGLRARWRSAWDALDRPKRTRWLDG